MVFPLYTLLLSLQNALCNCVTPDLRAITFDVVKKKGGVFLWFFYDTEITSELEDYVSTLLVEVDTYSKELDMGSYEVIQLDSSKPIPVQGKFAYLRYEKTLPNFERENYAFLLKEKEYPQHAIFRLDMQQALLGRVTPELRHVSVSADPGTKKLTAHFIYDGEISDLNQQLASKAIHDSRISFPDYEMDSFIERIDYPSEMRFHGKWLAYCRQESIYTDDGPIPSIRK